MPVRIPPRADVHPPFVLRTLIAGPKSMKRVGVVWSLRTDRRRIIRRVCLVGIAKANASFKIALVRERDGIENSMFTSASGRCSGLMLRPASACRGDSSMSCWMIAHHRGLEGSGRSRRVLPALQAGAVLDVRLGAVRPLSRCSRDEPDGPLRLHVGPAEHTRPVPITRAVPEPSSLAALSETSPSMWALRMSSPAAASRRPSCKTLPGRTRRVGWH